jgi:hypothetical protein
MVDDLNLTLLSVAVFEVFTQNTRLLDEGTQNAG